MTVTALIVAAGKGDRAGGGLPKQYRAVAGKPVLRWAAEALAKHPMIARTRVVIGAGQEELAAAALAGLDVGMPILGGAERADSVRAGLDEVQTGTVLIHDAARPFCPAAVIDRLIARLEFFEGAAPVLPVADTLAKGAETIEGRVERAGLLRVQTPQAFRVHALRQAIAAWQGPPATDETAVLRAAGLAVGAVEGDRRLEKLTTLADFTGAEEWLAGRLVPRTGFGVDVHAFRGPGPLTLGGVAIEHERGLDGHSDADVLLHAITDALLGAAGLGDIGEHFPPSDPQWKGASSDRFLIHAVRLLHDRGAIIDHIDCTIMAEKPKIGPHRAAMQARIAQIAGLAADQVSVKATTTERLGFVGREEGIMAQAIASIRMERPA